MYGASYEEAVTGDRIDPASVGHLAMPAEMVRLMQAFRKPLLSASALKAGETVSAGEDVIMGPDGRVHPRNPGGTREVRWP